MAAVAAVLFSGTWLAEWWLRGQVERIGRERLDLTVEVAEIHWLPWLGIQLEGVRAAPGETRRQGPFESLEIGELSVRSSGLPGRSLPVKLESIAARNVTLRVRPAPADEARDGEPLEIPELSRYVTLGRLDLSEARVVYDDGTGEPAEVPVVLHLDRRDADGKDVYGLAFRAGSAEDPLLAAGGRLGAAAPRLDLDELSASLDSEDPLERVIPGPFTGTLSGSAMLDLSDGRNGRLRIDAGRLDLDDAKPAFEDVQAELVLRESSIEVRSLAARYGGDRLNVSTATLDASDPERIRDLEGFVTFASGERPPYPEPLGGVIHAIGPGGRFDLSGSVPLGGEVTFGLEIRAGSASLRPEALPFLFTEVRGAAVVGPEKVTFGGEDGEDERVSARALEGTVRARGVYHIDAERLEGNVEAEDLTLAAVVSALRSDDAGRAPAGAGGVSARIVSDWSGEGASIDAEGDFEIHDASFFGVPVLSEIVQRIPAIGDPLGAGQAAGRFRIAREEVQLEQVTVWGPTMGLYGSGDVGFDGALAADVTVVPLGDWDQQLDELGVPVLGTVVSTLAGTVQSIAQTATSKLLYHFDVRGTVTDPKIRPVPAPALTEGMGRTLARLLRFDEESAGRDPDLVEAFGVGEGEAEGS